MEYSTKKYKTMFYIFKTNYVLFQKKKILIRPRKINLGGLSCNRRSYNIGYKNFHS